MLFKPPISGAERAWVSRRVAALEARRYDLERRRAIIERGWQALRDKAAISVLTAAEADRMDRLGETWDRLGDQIAQLERQIRDLEWP